MKLAVRNWPKHLRKKIPKFQKILKKIDGEADFESSYLENYSKPNGISFHFININIKLYYSMKY